MKHYNLQFSFFIIALIFVIRPELAQCQQIVRGPYLQMPSQTGIIVRWRTDSLTSSRVVYGTSLGVYTDTLENLSPTTEHSLEITNLQLQTRYFYAVGNNLATLSGGDTLHQFTTWPAAGTVKPLRFWAIGDFGKGNQLQKDVRDQFLAPRIPSLKGGCSFPVKVGCTERVREISCCLLRASRNFLLSTICAK